MQRTQVDVDEYRRKSLAKGLAVSYVDEMVERYRSGTIFLIIAGGREFSDWNLMYSRYWAWFDQHDPDYTKTVVLSGMASGVDELGYLISEDSGVPYEEYPANWDLYGVQAGFYLNTKMACRATHLLAMWDRKSPGTRDMIIKAQRMRLNVTVSYYNTVEPKQVNTLW